MKKEQHYLILGAGLAGLSLAHYLEKRNISFHILDQEINHSSVIAAGQINPMVFRRMTKSWRLDEFLPEVHRFYTEIGEALNDTFYHPLPIRRSFSHDQERDFWLKRQDLPEYAPYLKHLDETELPISTVKETVGTGIVLNSGFISSRKFVEKMRERFESKGQLTKTTVDYSELDPENPSWNGVEYDMLFCCEGYHVAQNPWFGEIPIESTKGEVLTIQSTEIPEHEALNRKCFILPIGNQQFKLGSTYTWKTPNVIITEEAKTELIANARNLIDADFKIIHHEAGVRPTVPDRRPVIGNHPKFKKLYIFNGLGTKGYMMAPLLAKEIVEHIEDNSPLHKEVDVQRYFSRLK